MPRYRTRRSVVRASEIASVAALAGCASPGGGEDGGGEGEDGGGEGEDGGDEGEESEGEEG